MTATPEALLQAFQEQIAHVEELPPRAASYGEPGQPMHSLIKARLETLGIERLFSHQARAYDAAMQGKDLVVVTGTNSGKTLCYNLPAAQMAMSEPSARALYLYPTKALAQDQLGKLEALLSGTGIRAGVYDGDTPKSHRPAIRNLSHVVLTNPDMLHVGILPSHESWTKMLKSLRLIVLDEMHSYRGVFGSHVGCVLRRLLRLCEWHRCRPQIVACSATIGNPLELFHELTGREGILIDRDGSPQGRRTFVFWNPPTLKDETHASANFASSEILATLCESGLRTLAFSRARVSAELILRYTRKRLSDAGKVPEASVEGYRAGYTPKERRQIEQALFKGKLLGLSATNAMEMGVDVGGLDVVIMNGFPGTLASFWQQAGRAGRGAKDGLAIMVAHDDPLEQFLIRQPDLVLNGRNENVCVNPFNAYILRSQLLCAAHERGLEPSELVNFGPNALEIAEDLDRSGELQFRSGRFYYPSFKPPALKINIRGMGGEQVKLTVEGEEIGTMDRWRAMQSAFPGAVYLHRGVSYLSTSLDLETSVATFVPQEMPYYTRAMVQSVIESRMPVRETPLGPANIGLVSLSATDMVIGYRQMSHDGDSVVGVESLELPPDTYETIGVRFDLPGEADDLEVVSAIHGLEHALLAVAPLLAGCDRQDLGSAWYSVFPDTLKPAIFLFDRTPGGVGLSEKLFESLFEWIHAAHRLLESCQCVRGCPACLMSSRCESNNEALDKQGTLKLLRQML